MLKRIIFGPWVGEFGWELFCWQAWIRATVARDFRDHDVTVICRPGHGFLYTDFAQHIRSYIPEGEETDMWKNYAVHKADYERLTMPPDSNIRWFCGTSGPRRWWVDGIKTEHHFISYRTMFERGQFRMFVPFVEYDPVDALLIVRNTDKCNTGFRNWSIQHAEEFVRKLHQQTDENIRIGCVGRSDSAAHIDGTADLRDIPLFHLAYIMSRARVIVGPQCGPIHFATLCELPQVAWQTCSEHAVRMVKFWNPFDVNVHVLPSPTDAYWKKRMRWMPSMDEILKATIHILGVTT